MDVFFSYLFSLQKKFLIFVPESKREFPSFKEFFKINQVLDINIFKFQDTIDSGSQIDNQWDAIERTLYQEEGEQVTDPYLMKECKLWRETFPHFRVRGTQIKIEKPENEEDEDEREKSLQTLENHIALKKIQEKRESIKNKVVEEIVGRLVEKFTEKKQEIEGKLVEDFQEEREIGVRITEVPVSPLPGISTSAPKTPEKGILKLSNKKHESKKINWDDKIQCFPDKEKLDSFTEIDVNEDFINDNISRNIFNLIGEELENRAEQEELRSSKVESKKFSLYKTELQPPRGDVIGLKASPKNNVKRVKCERLHSDSFQLKPIQLVNKIDKRYEELLNRITNKRYTEPAKHSRVIGETRSYQESLEKLRIHSGYEESFKKSTLPRINKFKNVWLDRGEMNSYFNSDLKESVFERITKEEGTLISPNRKPLTHREELSQKEIDDKFIMELKKEMLLKCKRPPQKVDGFEEIRLRRPKPYLQPPEVGRTLKSSSCGDLPKKNKKNVRSKKIGLESGKSESSLKPRAHTSNFNNSKPGRVIGSKVTVLEPIETGKCTGLSNWLTFSRLYGFIS